MGAFDVAGAAVRGILERPGKETAQRYLAGAMKGSMYMGGIGGVNEWAHGGSFWEGVKSGAVTGFMYGGLGTGLKSAAWNIEQGAKGAAANYGGYWKGNRDFIKSMGEGGGVSKQVKALWNLERTESGGVR